MASRDPQHPNILFVVSDDQGAWALGCAGNPEIHTPNLDRLASRGIRFDEFFCVSPVCSPARASLLTGDIPSRHGVHDWIRAGSMGPGRIDYLAGQTLVTDVLALRGWRCGLVGKWHLGASDRPRPGYVTWFAHQFGMGPYEDAPMVEGETPVTVPGYITDVLGDRASAFIRDEAARDAPFWLSLCFTAPHYPWIGCHPEPFTRLYDDCAFASCPDEPPHPWFIGGKPAVEKGRAQRRDNLVGYFAAVSAMDAAIGRVLDTLDAEGLAESTLVVFVGDNGMNMGHHGIWGKGNGTMPPNLYDTSVKVPCIVAQPGRIPAGRVDRTLLSGYDMFPTLLDWAGVPWSSGRPVPGRSFRAILEGRPDERDRPVVVFDEYGPARMLRTREWKYVHRHPDGPHELYDLEADPGERRNLVDVPRQARRVATMRDGLAGWFSRYVDPAREGLDKGVTGCGQVDRAETASATHRAFETSHTVGADWDLWVDSGDRPGSTSIPSNR